MRESPRLPHHRTVHGHDGAALPPPGRRYYPTPVPTAGQKRPGGFVCERNYGFAVSFRRKFFTIPEIR